MVWSEGLYVNVKPYVVSHLVSWSILQAVWLREMGSPAAKVSDEELIVDWGVMCCLPTTFTNAHRSPDSNILDVIPWTYGIFSSRVSDFLISIPCKFEGEKICPPEVLWPLWTRDLLAFLLWYYWLEAQQCP